MQLDLNLLVALDALLEEESVSGAADRLHLSAPAMSRTLGRIRAATGDPILVRTGHTMRPTVRARALRDDVRLLVLRSRELLAPEADLDLASLQRTFTIRSHEALMSVLAPALIRLVAAQAPGVRLRFLGESAGDTTDLRRGIVDLEIGSAAPPTPDVDQESLAVDPLVGIARIGNPLLEGRIDVARFAAANHIVVSRRGRLRDHIDDVLDDAGERRTVIAAVASTVTALEIVRSTDAVCVMPAAVAHRLVSTQDIQVFRLPFELPAVATVLAWHRQFTTDSGHEWMRGLVRDILTH